MQTATQAVKTFEQNPHDLWLVKVIKLDESESHAPQVVHCNGRSKQFPLNENTELTNQQIKVLEDAVVHTEIPISIDSPMWGSKEQANRLMPSMTYKERNGHCWLEEYSPRFAVMRQGIIQETINVPPQEAHDTEATARLAAAAAAGKVARKTPARKKGGPRKKAGGRKKNARITA